MTTPTAKKTYAEELFARSEEIEAKIAASEPPKMHAYIRERAREQAEQTFASATVQFKKMHEELGFTKFLAEREYYYKTDRYFQPNAELTRLLEEDGFKVSYAGNGTNMSITVNFEQNQK